jgi:aspartokinase-like uncharacterized kinase
MSGGPVVVKVGGSLYDLSDLGRRLQRWLSALAVPHTVLVPGGGPTADAVRTLDHCHGLGEEKAHWLALRALSVNAFFLANLVERAAVVGSAEACAPVWGSRGLPVLDAFAFAERDESEPGHLPHNWDVTTDALAARFALVLRARQLVLLKSTSLPDGLTWVEAGRQGWVDRALADVVGQAEAGASTTLRVRVVNLRAWRG